MNAPPLPASASTSEDGPVALYREIAHLAWGLRVHADVLERYAWIADPDGIERAIKDARTCLLRLALMSKDLPT
jgi:hypothetical protein